jgi:hypothetical protein
MCPKVLCGETTNREVVKGKHLDGPGLWNNGTLLISQKLGGTSKIRKNRSHE